VRRFALIQPRYATLLALVAIPLLPATSHAAPSDENLPAGCTRAIVQPSQPPRVVVPPVEYDTDADNVELDGTVIVSPERVEFTDPVQAGDIFTCTLTVRNRHEETATFELASLGITGSREPNAGYEFIDDTDDRWDATAGSWLVAAVDEVELEPRGVARVPVVVTVPDEPPTGSAYGSVDVVSRTSAPAGDTNVGIESHVAQVFLLRVGGDGAPDLSLTDVDAPKLRWDRESWPLTASLDNEGTLHASAAGRVRVRSIFGSTVAELPIARETVLPGGREQVDVRWKGVPWFGFYRWDVRMANAPGAPESIATADGWFIALPPWWMLALVALAIVAWIVHRVRRRRREWTELMDDELDSDPGEELGIEDHELGG
jgi:hypothetical protein